MTETIHQEQVYAVEPTRIYALLTNADEFSKLSGGAPAEIDATAGGAFSCFGGMIEGRNIECEAGVRLVQAWRVKAWEPGVYSLVRFELRAHDGGTRVCLDHSSFPAGQGEHLAAGWHKNYWDPLRQALE